MPWLIAVIKTTARQLAIQSNRVS